MDSLGIIHIERVRIMSASPAVVVPQDGEQQLVVWSKSSEICDDVISTEWDKEVGNGITTKDGEKQLVVWSKSSEICDDVFSTDKEVSRFSDDTTTKVRKPYTITKQRERWTDEEHQKFLEALKLYGRAWRQIEEHVGTKTAVQIRSHAQKFFSKLEREGSSGSSKGPISEIDIPPPRPKRKPAHPYPRKGVEFSSRSASVQSRSLLVSGRMSSGSLHGDNAAAILKTNILETNDVHFRNHSSKKASAVNFCQKPRKRGTEEVECDAFPNEAQEMPKLSRSACNQPELTSSPIGISAPQPDSLMLHNNNMPFGVYGSRLLTTLQQMAVPYHYPMHSLATLQSAAPLLNSATTNPSQLGKLDHTPTLASLFAAHAHLTSSLMHNPIALAGAAATAATTPCPGLGPQPPPLHLPLRPPSIFNDRLNTESLSTVAAAMAAAAAASFVDASAWLALHGTLSHPPNAPEVRSLFQPNPVVHSALIEDRQQKRFTDSSEGSKNGDKECEQTSPEEHEASTVDGMPETTTHTHYPNCMADDQSISSANHPQNNSHQCEKKTLMDQEKPGHNSSTDSSSNGKQGKKRNGLNGAAGNLLLVESKNDLQNSAYVTMNGKRLGKLSTEVHNGEMNFSPSMYQGSNSPKSGKTSEGDVYKGEYKDRLEALTTSVHVIDCTISSVGKAKNYIAPQCTTNTSKMEAQVKVDVSLQHVNGSSHKGHDDMSQTRHEDMSGEVSVPAANQRQCICSCGSTEYKRAETHNSPVISSKLKDTEMKEKSGPKYHTEDRGSEIIPYENEGKVLVQACLTRWQGGEIMFTHTCTNPKGTVATPRGKSTCRADAKEKDSHQEEARSSLAMGLINGSKQSLPLIQPQSVHGSNASSSGSSKYNGHGFVPYRRS